MKLGPTWLRANNVPNVNFAVMSACPEEQTTRLATTIAEYVASVCRTCDDTIQHVQILVVTVWEEW